MPKQHDRERELLAAYDKKLKYYSPASEPGLSRIMLTVDAPVSGEMLDVGCGDGRAFAYAYRHGMSYTGVDYSANRIAKARETQGQIANNTNRPMFLCGDLYEALPSINPGFDLVFCCELLEHLEEPDIIWAEMLRLSRGMIVATIPVNMPHENHLSVFENEEEVNAVFHGIKSMTRMSFTTPGGHQRPHFLFTA